MSLPDIAGVARKIGSPLFQGARQQFAARNGQYVYQSGQHSHYIEDPTGRINGWIIIDPEDIQKMLRVYSSEDEVVRLLLIHEMGHFMYRMQDRATKPKSGVEASMSWCFRREAYACMFAFRVVKELKARSASGAVLAPNKAMDIFDELDKAEKSGKNTLNIAYSVYASEPQYALYCRQKLLAEKAPAEEIPTVIIRGKPPSKTTTSAKPARP